MITPIELCPKLSYSALPMDHQWNLQQLHYRLNCVRVLFDRPMIVTSGYRTLEDHYQIYNHLNSLRRSQGKEPLKIPMESRHLVGLAADIGDEDRSLKEWVIKNISVCEELGLYFEDFAWTNGFVHIQCIAPRSGQRFFKP